MDIRVGDTIVVWDGFEHKYEKEYLLVEGSGFFEEVDGIEPKVLLIDVKFGIMLGFYECVEDIALEYEIVDVIKNEGSLERR